MRPPWKAGMKIYDSAIFTAARTQSGNHSSLQLARSIGTVADYRAMANGRLEQGGLVKRSWLAICAAVATCNVPIAFADASSDDGSALDEIVVTAQKKTERLQDVPIAISVISGTTLADTNQVRIQDYFMTVPGLSATPLDSGTTQLSIRGITTGTNPFANPTVGITVDDLPYGSATGLGAGATVPDWDPSDLERVEVLRGPQGTLYGANSIGGLVKFVTVDPSTDRFTGRVQTDVSTIDSANGPSYGVRGSVNVPLSDTLAVRVSGFARRDAGYIDDLETHQSGVNWGNADGGRVSSLWKPDDDFSLKLSASLQRMTTHGSNFANYEVAGLGALQENYTYEAGWLNRSTDVYSAVAKARLGEFTLTSITGYSIDKYAESFDESDLASYITPLPGFASDTAALILDYAQTRKFTEELRLTRSFGTKIDWLLGGFLDGENTHYVQAVQGTDGPALLGIAENLSWEPTYHEYAVFTDVTLHLTDRFEVQVGGRESEIRQGYAETDSGLLNALFFGVSNPAVDPLVTTRNNAFTYMLTPDFKITPNFMMYSRLASGYQVGGPNQEASFLHVPLNYDPAKTVSFEVGSKGDIFGQYLSIDASVYYIDWREIQIVVENTGGFTYDLNGGRAKSQGVELSLYSKPISGLNLSAWVAYDDAYLVDGLPPASTVLATAGQRLPNTPLWTGNFSAQQDFLITGDLSGFIAGVVSLQGGRTNGFVSGNVPQIYLPPYTKTDLRTGLKVHGWEASIYANNVTDRRGALGGNQFPPPPGLYFIQPRTIGLNLVKNF
jgi:iron complex outermembrane recepter protein